ncbi:glycine/D-amino acid oxidase-like deaminating enzyme [Stella humosa]|uniref:Glycine/D-amino acid oxidase-like deaminating enzyme n=1 Tax=Stella humosa TaxID=94 RepID=A0A3N1KR69_9PROT|nr:FAD-dependent oxidoreductase [Stella humosa]ROP80818.1 glycine/D-amino acid oxidase-like deaminating enzyme [Stella humosa]BBK33391.1 FAD-dependent oxidoreductase [Stella humosa]
MKALRPIGMHSPLDDPQPLADTYRQTSRSPLAASPLDGRVQADVAVIGGGFTGLSTALHLAEAGARVVVLEAKEVGAGGSGRAFGQVVPYAKHGQDHILAHFGPERGERIIDLVAGGPDLVYGLIQKHGIECETVRTGLLFAGHTPGNASALEARARFWQARGAPVEILDRDAAERLTGTRYYPSVLLDRRGGTVNPLAYCRGLAAAAVAAGARLHEGSRATALTRREGGWTVETAGGAVDADQVVLATDAYTDGLWPGLAGSLVPLRAYHLVSAPLSQNLRGAVLPGRQSLTDTRRLYSGIRMRPDGRLHLSSDGPAFRNDSRAFRDKASRRVTDLFPFLSELAWEEEVAGWVGMSADQYPHIHALAPGMWAALGLSGRGIAFGTLLGREVAGRLLGRPEQDLAIPVTPLQPIAVRPFTRPLVGSLMNFYRVVDGIELGRPYLRQGR